MRVTFDPENMRLGRKDLVILGLHVNHKFARSKEAAPAAVGALLDHVQEFCNCEVDVVCGDLNFTRVPGGRNSPTAAPAARLVSPTTPPPARSYMCWQLFFPSGWGETSVSAAPWMASNWGERMLDEFEQRGIIPVADWAEESRRAGLKQIRTPTVDTSHPTPKSAAPAVSHY